MNLVEVVCLVSSVLALLWFVKLSVIVAIADITWHRIPNRLVLPALIGMPVLFAVPLLAASMGGSAADQAGQLQSILDGCLGALVLFMGYFMLAMFGGLGGGDVKLAGIIGLWLGDVGGWGAVLLGTLLAWGAVGVACVAYAILRRVAEVNDPQTSRDPPEIPFAPFLLGGAWTVLLVSR